MKYLWSTVHLARPDQARSVWGVAIAVDAGGHLGRVRGGLLLLLVALLRRFRVWPGFEVHLKRYESLRLWEHARYEAGSRISKSEAAKYRQRQTWGALVCSDLAMTQGHRDSLKSLDFCLAVFERSSSSYPNLPCCCCCLAWDVLKICLFSESGCSLFPALPSFESRTGAAMKASRPSYKIHLRCERDASCIFVLCLIRMHL